MNNYIDSEIILKRKVKPLVYVYIMIIVTIILSLIIFFLLFNYKMYYDVNGVIINDNNNYYIKIYVPLDKLKYIIKNNKLIINKKEYNYKIEKIEGEYFTDNINTYQIIYINSNIHSKYKLNNLTIKIKLQKENKKLINYIIK